MSDLMKGFLKCFYGFQNLGDELLFWGVVDYIDQQYPEITELTVEVGDQQWMEEWRSTNQTFVAQLGLAPNFTQANKTVRFVSLSKNITNQWKYDRYFFGGGEVFAESRGFYWGWNYLLRYWYTLLFGSFVLLGGIETATTRRQKLLYRLVLPKAQQIVCREQTSYETALSYNPRTILYQDFALPVIQAYQKHQSWQPSRFDRKSYVLINMIASMNTEESYDRLRVFLHQYPDATPIYIAGKSINSDDITYGRRLQGAYPELQLFLREEHTLQELLDLFAYAQAWFASRLHILLLLQAFNHPRFALVYAEKIQKLINSTVEL